MVSQGQKHHSARRAFWTGFIFTVAGAVLWGFSGSCAQQVFAITNLTPLFVTAFRSAVAGLLFLVVIMCRHRGVVTKLLHSKRDLLSTILLGGFLYGAQITFLITVQATNAGTATVLQMVNPVFVLVFVCVRNSKLPRVREIAGLFLGLSSVLIIATQGDLTSLKLPLHGVVWGVISAVCAAGYIVVPRECHLAERYGSLVSTGVAIMVAAVFANIVLFAVQGGAVPAQGASTFSDSFFGLFDLDAYGYFVLVIGVAVLGTFAAFGLFLSGVAKVGPVTGSFLGVLEPASATVISAVWLGTVVTGVDWLGFALMTVMVVLMTLPSKKTRTDRPSI